MFLDTQPPPGIIITNTNIQQPDRETIRASSTESQRLVRVGDDAGTFHPGVPATWAAAHERDQSLKASRRHPLPSNKVEHCSTNAGGTTSDPFVLQMRGYFVGS